MFAHLAEHGSALLLRLAAEEDRVLQRSSEARIHSLRVAIKRLRALVHMLKSLSPQVDPPKRAERRLKTMFKAAGRVREAQVMSGLVARYKDVPAAHRSRFQHRLAKRMEGAMERIPKVVRKADGRMNERLAGYLQRASGALAEGREAAAMRRYADAELECARVLLATGDAEEVLHEMRKHVKKAWYALRLLKGSARYRTEIDILDTVQQRLGQWQDHHILKTELEGWKGGGKARATLMAATNKQLERLQAELISELG